MDTFNWKWFRLEQLFIIKKGKRLTKEDMEPGMIPYIGAIDSNNGVSAHISNSEHLHQGNTISVTYNGSIAEAFYQVGPFWATDDVNVLYPKFELNAKIALFFTTIINKEKYRFNYGRKWDKEKMEKSEIKVPQTSDGEPDFEAISRFMDSIISTLPPKAKAVWNNRFDTSPESTNRLTLEDRTWKWFRYDQIFTICKGFYNKKPEHNPNGDISFIGATDSNNGITSRTDISTIEQTSKTGDDNNAPLEEKLFQPNCITVSNNGSVGFAFYQRKAFTCTHDVNPLYLKNHEMNAYIAMFLCTLIEKERFRWDYGRKWRPIRMPSSLIKLPVDNNDEPDWDFMERYIKGLPFSRLTKDY